MSFVLLKLFRLLFGCNILFASTNLLLPKAGTIIINIYLPAVNIFCLLNYAHLSQLIEDVSTSHHLTPWPLIFFDFWKILFYWDLKYSVWEQEL